VHAWGSTSLSLAFCCVSLELNSRFRNYPIVPTILRNVACKFRNYPMVSTIPIMCACTGFLSSNRELYGTYTAYSTRNSFNPGASWGPESALESGFENPCHRGHGPESALESGFENPDRRSWGPESALESGFENPGWRSLGPRVRIGIWIRKPRLALPEAQSPHWNLDSKTPAILAMGPESALESGFENPDRRSLGPTALESGFQCGLAPPLGGVSPHWNLDSKISPGAPLGPRVRIGIWIRKPQPCIANAISLCEMSRASTLKAIGNAIGVLFSNVDSPPPRGGPSPHQHLDSGCGPAPPPSTPPEST